MNDVVSIIVTFNPDISRLESTIRILSLQSSDIVIVDNTEGGCEVERLATSPSVTVISNKDNLGVAKALNIGLDHSIQSGYRFALLLDQDSVPTDNLVTELAQGHSALKKVILSCPVLLDVDAKGNPDPKSGTRFSKVDFAITSGSMLCLKHMAEIGPFEEKLFIDCVDTEFCLRARALKFSIVKCHCAVLHHCLGSMKEVFFLGFKIFPTNHSPLRRYYKMRNRVFLWKKFFSTDKVVVLKNIVRSLCDVFEILIFEKDSLLKIKYILLGLKDGLLNKYGKL